MGHRHYRIRMNRKGFTLTELLTVVIIMGTLLSFGVLAYNTMMDRLNAERQMKEMFIDLMNARVRAMQRNRPHFVVFTSSQYTIYEDTSPAPDGDGKLTTGTGGDRMYQQKNLISKFPVTLLPSATQWSPAAPLQFNAKGIVPTDEAAVGTVRITTPSAGEYDCIIVSEIKIILGKWDGASSTCMAR